MIVLGVGPSLCGKTHYLRMWILPMLLSRPRQLLDGAPERYRYCLVDDPKAQYPGQRFRDVSEFRRASTKPRIACFDRADPEALCELALAKRDTILVLDELDLAFPSDRAPSPNARRIANAGRHDGIVVVGTTRRLKNVRTEVRANIPLVFFGNLTDSEDRRYAAATANISEEMLSSVEKHTFLEVNTTTNQKVLTKIAGDRRVEITRY